METWEDQLVRWQDAGLIDGETAARVRAFETQGTAHTHKPVAARWQVTIALVLGGILLAAGLLLFVSSHWDDISPDTRLALVVGIFAAVHLGGVLATERFPALATTLHAIGTVGAGGAIATIGQIFNMQEHWPSAVLLWALCAAAGYALLRDQFQQVAFMLLGPAWLLCEFGYRADRYRGGDVYNTRAVAVLAAIYLTSFVRSDRRIVRWILFSLSAVAILWGAVFLSEGFNSWGTQPAMPLSLRVIAIAFIVAMMVAGVWLKRHILAPVAAVAVMVFAMPWLHHLIRESYGRGQTYTRVEPAIMSYCLAAAVAILFTWWGVHERSRAVVNYGVVAFALCVTWFYFSSLMDKLGRSLGLIGLGALFLLGGWVLERVRRKLIVSMTEVQA